MGDKIIVETMDGRKEVERERAPFPCLVCRKELWNVFTGNNQPCDACTFNSHGHYGSTVFDEMDGAQLEVNICDACLKEAQAHGIVGYWPGSPKRKLRPWAGE